MHSSRVSKNKWLSWKSSKFYGHSNEFVYKNLFPENPFLKVGCVCNSKKCGIISPADLRIVLLVFPIACFPFCLTWCSPWHWLSIQICVWILLKLMFRLTQNLLGIRIKVRVIQNVDFLSRSHMLYHFPVYRRHIPWHRLFYSLCNSQLHKKYQSFVSVNMAMTSVNEGRNQDT